MAQEKQNPPVKKFRVGNISANIWERQFDDKTFHNVSFERSYQVQDEQTGEMTIKSSGSFDLADVGALKLVIGMAEKFLTEKAVEAQA